MGNDSISVINQRLVPGSNTHRTPYGGRASQYFCEYSVQLVSARWNLHMALWKRRHHHRKHFAFNDQEGGRSGISVFMTEQRAAKSNYVHSKLHLK